MQDEGLANAGEGVSPGGPHERVTRNGGTTITERDETTVFSGDVGEVAAFGIKEQWL